MLTVLVVQARKKSTMRLKSLQAYVKGWDYSPADMMLNLHVGLHMRSTCWQVYSFMASRYMCLFFTGLRLGLVRLLVHDVQDHLAGRGAPLGCWMDGDGFFSCACVFLPVDVHPEERCRDYTHFKWFQFDISTIIMLCLSC